MLSAEMSLNLKGSLLASSTIYRLGLVLFAAKKPGSLGNDPGEQQTGN